jgi:hypothetical protein
VTGALGFATFLAYMGYGYLDRWHGAATLVLLPVFLGGLVRSRSLAGVAAPGWLRSDAGRAAHPLARAGRWGLVATGAGMTIAGAVILVLGATEVFVAEDLAFMGVTRGELDRVNPRLVPLIAHDRAGFGGGLLTAGLLVLACGWWARPGRGFHQAIVLAGSAGFGCAIGTHFVEGYRNTVHLLPAFAGAAMFAASALALVVGHAARRPTPVLSDVVS